MTQDRIGNFRVILRANDKSVIFQCKNLKRNQVRKLRLSTSNWLRSLPSSSPALLSPFRKDLPHRFVNPDSFGFVANYESQQTKALSRSSPLNCAAVCSFEAT